MVTEETVYETAEDSTLTAKWDANEYTVTLDDGNSTTEITVTYDEAIGELPIPEREGYTFAGWYDAEGNLVTKDTVYTSTDDLTLTAKWTKVVNEEGSANTSDSSQLSLYISIMILSLAILIVLKRKTKAIVK